MKISEFPDLVISFSPSTLLANSMPKPEHAFHCKTVAHCFNAAWDYLEKKDRDVPDEQRMLHLEHASLFHGTLVGTPRNQAVADWQIFRFYAALEKPRLALQFAKSSLALCEQHDLSEILCTAHEAMAREHAVAEDYASARDYMKEARQLLDTSTVDAEDRAIFLAQIRETEQLIGR